jgi:hypothetical protein
MCNAVNHWQPCFCGFGGDTGGGGGRRGRGRSSFVATAEPECIGWTEQSRGTVDSYVNPNARCPECGAPVFFYRSPYDGRVYFDELGWPWPKHWCTDNSRGKAPRGPAPGLVPKVEPAWRHEGWHPILSANARWRDEHMRITGRFQDEFLELHFLESEAFDPDSPVLLREQVGKPDFFEMTLLRSNPADVEPKKSIAFRARLAHAGDETLRKAALDEPGAIGQIGEYILWELDDPTGARPYLERAVAGGVIDAAFDLIIAKVFSTPKSRWQRTPVGFQAFLEPVGM